MAGPGGFVHPETDILDDLLGEAEPAASDRLHAHLVLCPDCRTLREAWQQSLAEARAEGRGGHRVRRLHRLGGYGCRVARHIACRRGLAELSAPGGTEDGQGRISVRAGERSATVHVERVPAPVEGRVLVLWCQSEGRDVRPLGFVPVRADGRGRADLVLPVGTGVGDRLVATEEPTPLPPRPTGPVRLAGTIRAM